MGISPFYSNPIITLQILLCTYVLLQHAEKKREILYHSWHYSLSVCHFWLCSADWVSLYIKPGKYDLFRENLYSTKSVLYANLWIVLLLACLLTCLQMVVTLRRRISAFHGNWVQQMGLAIRYMPKQSAVCRHEQSEISIHGWLLLAIPCIYIVLWNVHTIIRSLGIAVRTPMHLPSGIFWLFEV